MRFRVLIGDEVIGYSDLEHGDPPMGVVFGSFVPTERYEPHRPLFREIARLGVGEDGADLYRQRDELGLVVEREDGQRIEPNLGVTVFDLTDEVPEEPPTLQVIGIDSALYAELFPVQYEAYFGPPEAC